MICVIVNLVNIILPFVIISLNGYLVDYLMQSSLGSDNLFLLFSLVLIVFAVKGANSVAVRSSLTVTERIEKS